MKLHIPASSSEAVRNAYETYNSMYDIERRDVKILQMYNKFGEKETERNFGAIKSFASRLRSSLVEAKEDNAKIGFLMDQAMRKFDYSNPVLDFVLDEDEKESRDSVLKSLKSISQLITSGDEEKGFYQLRLLKKKFLSGETSFPYDEAWISEKLNGFLAEAE